MNPTKAYKFCPVCSNPLNLKEERVLVCKNGHKLYINPVPCNAAIIENEIGEILLVKRKYDPNKGFWDWPGGFINPGENLEQSVKREIKEELNIEIEIDKIVGIYNDEYLYQGINFPTIGMVVSVKIVSGKISPSDDVSGYKFFPRSEVLKQKLAFKTIKQGISDYLKTVK